MCYKEAQSKDECGTAIIKMNEYREAQSRMNVIEEAQSNRMWTAMVLGIAKLTLMGRALAKPNRISHNFIK